MRTHRNTAIANRERKWITQHWTLFDYFLINKKKERRKNAWLIIDRQMFECFVRFPSRFTHSFAFCVRKLSRVDQFFVCFVLFQFSILFFLIDTSTHEGRVAKPNNTFWLYFSFFFFTFFCTCHDVFVSSLSCFFCRFSFVLIWLRRVLSDRTPLSTRAFKRWKETRDTKWDKKWISKRFYTYASLQSADKVSSSCCATAIDQRNVEKQKWTANGTTETESDENRAINAALNRFSFVRLPRSLSLAATTNAIHFVSSQFAAWRVNFCRSFVVFAWAIAFLSEKSDALKQC